MDFVIEFNPDAFKHEADMARMTEEEAARLDKKWTKNPPNPGPNGTGYFTQCKKAAHTITIDSFTANYLSSKAIADHKTPAEIIGEMVQERIAASMQGELNTASV